jgi:hypothetical protein
MIFRLIAAMVLAIACAPCLAAESTVPIRHLNSGEVLPKNLPFSEGVLVGNTALPVWAAGR